MGILSNRAADAAACFAAVQKFFLGKRYGARHGDPGICDFTFGNPHEFQLPALVEATRRRFRPIIMTSFARYRETRL